MVSTRSRAYPPRPPKEKTFSSFKLFPKLPLEIQLMIWEAAASVPRIVYLNEYELPECRHAFRRVRSDREVPDFCEDPLNDQFCRRKGIQLCTIEDAPNDWELDDEIFDARWQDNDLPDIWPPVGLKTDSPVPSLFYVCRDSHRVASRLYPRLFPTFGSLSNIHFNSTVDTLHINADTFLDYGDPQSSVGAIGLVCQEDRAKVQNLSLDSELVEYLDEESYLPWLCEAPTQRGKKPRSEFLERVFLNPVDLDRRFYMFEHPKYHERHDPYEEVPTLDYFLRMKDTEFEAVRLEETKAMEEPWPRPILEHKVVTSETDKRRLESLQKEYESVPGCRCYEKEDPFRHPFEEFSDSDSDSDSVSVDIEW
ncbi:hypothetical protein G7Y89_g12887 [Cudoniella acicularis]|uniref:2EXR domain-containing protein n=1 Tax=Cudoniella acicularis TaxID=354080 RepID=A0A8H4RAL2_9HELO|nr:hypothetical protein G7Y89_g12887 [Cudoniella acicularis]